MTIKKEWLGNCWAESYCKGYPHKCGYACIGYAQLDNVYRLSGMPERYQRDVALNLAGDDGEKDRDAYLFLRDFMLDGSNIDGGKGLYIVSKYKGNGKTAWACKIMSEHFKRIALTNNLRCRGVYINVPTFLQELRLSMDKQSDAVEAKLEHIESADLVIWDDIGTENPSAWVRERLYSFINHRYANNLSQVFTSNIYLEELANERYMGERIVSRIAGQCTIVEFLQKDRRADA